VTQDWVPWVLTAVLATATLLLALRAQSQDKSPAENEVSGGEESPDLREEDQLP
jgi:hypothetical protein